MPTPEDIRTQILTLVRQYHQAKFVHKTFDPDKDLVHYAGRVFDAEEIVNLVDASLDFYLTANRYAERFEAEFADYLGLSNALLVNSGSSANTELPLPGTKTFVHRLTKESIIEKTYSSENLPSPLFAKEG